MAEAPEYPIKDRLMDRRSSLERALVSAPGEPELERLLAEVDAALERTEKGTYGLCEVCHETIEKDRLAADPLCRFCLGHMSPSQQQALEQDLDLAAQIQSALLPPQGCTAAGWDTAYYYEGAGPISGDYCDLLPAGEALYFLVGDVSGKGIASSMLTGHLHATFQALVPLNLALDEIMARASRMLCESTLPTYFATLICGRAHSDGKVEMCIAGHNPPILASRRDASAMEATGLPIGLFCEEKFSVRTFELAQGDIILAYTDGLTEAVDPSGVQYGTDRIVRFVGEHRSLSPSNLVSACVRDLKNFTSGAPSRDDVTIMVVRRTSGGPDNRRKC